MTQETRADWRDGAVLGLTVIPVALAVSKVGLQSGLDPWLVLTTSAFMATASVQLLFYEAVATGGSVSLATWCLMALVRARLLLYSLDLNRMVRHKPLGERFASAFFMGDMAFLEFVRVVGEEHEHDRALRRFQRISRSLWAGWQIGTVIGLSTDLTLPGLPKEAVSVLIFSCLSVAALKRLFQERATHVA